MEQAAVVFTVLVPKAKSKAESEEGKSQDAGSCGPAQTLAPGLLPQCQPPSLIVLPR